MIGWTGGEIAAAVGGRLSVPAGSRPEVEIDVSGPVVVDSRQATAGSLFVAIEGEHADGHEFAAAAHAAGAALVLADRDVPGVPCVVVPDTVTALGRLARAHLDRLLAPADEAGGASDAEARSPTDESPIARRPSSQSPFPIVIGITGSSGKTTTKDLLAQLLARHGTTVAPPGSYNNEIGVPLTVLRADESTRYLVLEMGARGRGHICHLCSIAPPRVGVVLNVGLAHAGEFGTKQDTAEAKSELVAAVPADGLAVLNGDDDLVAAMRDRTEATVLTFGLTGDIQARDIRLDGRGRAAFTLVTAEGEARVELRLAGPHHVSNALAAATVATGLGIDTTSVAAALSAATATSRWRMEVHDRPDGVTVINDAYNANPDSVRAGLEALTAISAAGEAGDCQDAARVRRRSWAVLGEMLELGAWSVHEHESVGRLAARLGVDRIVAVGAGAEPIHRGAMAARRRPIARRAAAAAGVEPVEAPVSVVPPDRAAPPPVASLYVPDAGAAIALLRAELRPGDVVLVKASRGIGLEWVAESLLAADEPPTADRARAVAEGDAEEVLG
ncbi:MAG TPA: UDP-N-acetylmuramoyl-tripeptide--D-alanyl-D-alanine ligase [Actinomycetes bacterium]|nr:UDP-N-acetylmuramoyl-tripeptide--D-alanyl-D-alanine ligase [Actinomycetes bacterium]